MKIFLVGGGTMGSVSPLLAVKEELEKRNLSDKPEFLWLGTKEGVEREIIYQKGISYQPIWAGKWRRYFSFKNFTDLIKTVIGIFQATYFIIKYQPKLVLSAGSFVAFPVAVAVKITGRKMVLHQMDLRPGLTNKISAPFVSHITVAFPEMGKNFDVRKTIVLATPVKNLKYEGDKKSALKIFGFKEDLPTVLIMGGSLGAEKINKLVFQGLAELLSFCQIIHVTGLTQELQWENRQEFGVLASRYVNFAYLEENLVPAYHASDLVVGRAGLGMISELLELRKPMMLIPIPDNQQEDNANYFRKAGAALVLEQSSLEVKDFISNVRSLLADKNALLRLSKNSEKIVIGSATEKYVDFVISLLEKK